MKHLKRFWKWLCKTKTRTVALFYFLFCDVYGNGNSFLSAFNINVPESLIICVYTECGVIGLTSGAIALKSLRVGEVELELEQSEVSEDD